MSERPQHRRPATFKLDDPGVVVMDPDDTSRPSRGTIHITPERTWSQRKKKAHHPWSPTEMPLAMTARMSAKTKP